MGAFRSKPIVDKFSRDEENDKLRCASSTMQGWRVTQEDAYNFILDYDKDTAFFSVYDGHGGHEVAEYLQRNLPQFLKDMDSYKEGNIEKTLIDGFLKMDASLNTEEVMAILKEIAMEGADEEENIDKLYEEASMPVEEVIEKYRDGEGQSEETSKESGSKSKCDSSNEAGSSKERSRPERSRRKHDDSSSSQTSEMNSSEKSSDNFAEQVSAVTGKEEKSTDVSEEKSEKNTSEDLKEESEKSEGKESVVQNGEVSPEKENLTKSDSPQDQKGEICKGKGKAVAKRIVPITVDKKNTEPPQSDEEIYKMFLKKYVESEEESDDAADLDDSSEEDVTGEIEEDESENGIEEDIEDEDADEADDDDEEEESEEEEDEDDDEEELLDRDYEFEKPGIKSGSTGVVALLKGNELYVGNVGDSRCVVCREGKAVQMSYDHKPKNPAEKERVIKAGGEVDEVDDRVNDGLNMSRAFGDFFYKSNKELSQTEQMIIALPDVKTLTIDPNKDEFMVLASDGIWNVKDCQQVIDFLRPRIAKCEGKLSSVVEELFDECLSKFSFAEGTDNMTLILVQFKSNIAKRSSSPQPENPAKKMKNDSKQESDVKC